MKTETYCKFFKTENEARQRMIVKNQLADKGSIYCLVDNRKIILTIFGAGRCPNCGTGAVDLETAIDLGGGYEWSVR